ncbi:hypothetical protein AXX17_ATUG01590 [Arabidopsis thaliana]|uniref:DUF4216 domain-containing protein n=1 Tax=Arabidopsis thaliana TaxID=3702 RepID=A0A178U7Y3_ARATH|nr:hypothetical protein AXX17_ATUG01590 [Arabidopsis thaliana]
MQTNTQFDHNSRIWYLGKFSGSWEELLEHGQRSLTHGQVATGVTPPFHQLRLQDSADFGSKVGNLSRKAPRVRCPTHVGSAAGGANFALGMPILAHSCPLPCEELGEKGLATLAECLHDGVELGNDASVAYLCGCNAEDHESFASASYLSLPFSVACFMLGIRVGIPMTSDNEDTLKWSAYGPRLCARSYTGYIVNGNRFHTVSVDRQTQNCGVLHEATLMCMASAKDNTPMCQWANIGNGVKEEDGFTLVKLHQSQVSFERDPYILASQAKQVFYSRADESSSWYVAMRGSTRRYSAEDGESGNADVGPLPVLVDIYADDLVDIDRNARSDCEGIYVKYQKKKKIDELAERQLETQEFNEVEAKVGDKDIEMDADLLADENNEVEAELGDKENEYADNVVNRESEEPVDDAAATDAEDPTLNVAKTAAEPKRKKKRGPTKMKHIAKDPNEKARFDLDQPWKQTTASGQMEKKATEIDIEGTQDSATTNPKEDVLSQILGSDNPERLRAMGRGMSLSKLACFQVNSHSMAAMENNQIQMKNRIQDLEQIIEKLYDQFLIESATKPEAPLWRPVPEMSTIEDVVGEMIAWDADLCIVPPEGVIVEDIAHKSPRTTP